MSAILDITGPKSLLQRDGESATEVAAPEYGAPEIFNSDQGSRYTAKEHIAIQRGQVNVIVSKPVLHSNFRILGVRK